MAKFSGWWALGASSWPVPIRGPLRGRAPPAALDLRRVGPPWANTGSPHDGPCPARPPAGLWRRHNSCSLGCRHSPAGGRAGQGPLSGEYVFVDEAGVLNTVTKCCGINLVLLILLYGTKLIPMGIN